MAVYQMPCSLGQNKMEQQTPFPTPPQGKDEGARRAKTHHFPILDLGGRGGLGFPFILSKIVALVILSLLLEIMLWASNLSYL